METETRGQAIQMKRVFNPTSSDLHFKYDSAPYILPAGEVKEFVDYVAEMAASNLADKEMKTTDPAEHKVLMGAYLENLKPEIIAQKLGIDLGKIRQEAVTKEKKEAKVSNLEAEVEVMKKEMADMKMAKEEKEDIKEKIIEEKVVPEEEEKVDKRTKEYKESVK